MRKDMWLRADLRSSWVNRGIWYKGLWVSVDKIRTDVEYSGPEGKTIGSYWLSDKILSELEPNSGHPGGEDITK